MENATNWADKAIAEAHEAEPRQAEYAARRAAWTREHLARGEAAVRAAQALGAD